jgi:hypothetical protein
VLLCLAHVCVSGQQTVIQSTVSGNYYALCIAPHKMEFNSDDIAPHPSAFIADSISRRVQPETNVFVYEYNTKAIQKLDPPEIELKTEPATKWVRKKVNTTCLSSNPEDCLVWCLVEIPAATYKYKVVLDPNDEKYDMVRPLAYGSWTLPNRKEPIIGVIKWVEAPNPKEIDSAMIDQIWEFLQALGYPCGDESTALNQDILNAIDAYQTQHALARGAITNETLYEMGLQPLATNKN